MAGMAFPIPSHLPRKQDVSSKILNKIDSATYRTLNSTLTATWLTELDETVQTTKTRIHDRIHLDLPLFQRQLQSANSIRTRLQTLTNNVDSLHNAVTDQQSGLVPVLLRGLAKRSELVQEAADIEIRHKVLSHILDCKTKLANADALVASGQLSEAVGAIDSLYALLASAPEALTGSDIFLSFTRKHQSLQALVQEQLSEAYTRSIAVSFSLLVLRSSVQVRGSDALISLSSILSSLTRSSLDQHLTTLRRDLLTYIIEYILKQPSSISIGSTSSAEHSITLLPSPPVNDSKSVRIDNLSQVLDFLSSHLFPALPPSDSSNFRQSLFKPMALSLLNILLIPSLPSSFGLLPPFLGLAKHAVTFESKAVTLLTGSSTTDLPVRAWVDGLSTHYEKQRRLELLGNCRVLVLSPEDSKAWFQFEIEIPSESVQTTIVPVQQDVGTENAVDSDFKDDAWGFEDEVEDSSSQTEKAKDEDIQDDAWGFGDEEVEAEEKKSSAESSTAQADTDNGWGFDDDVPIDEPESTPDLNEAKSNGESEVDRGDAWGWNDDANVVEEEKGEDGSWDDDPWGDSPTTNIEHPIVPPALPTPKTATRLEKLANKGKKPVNDRTGVDDALVPVAPIPLLSYSIPKTQGKAPIETRTSAPLKRPPDLKTNFVSREHFAVPEKAKRLVRAVENIIDECKQFQASSLFPFNPTSPSAVSSQAGSILAQAPASLVDLYISIYPVKFTEELTQSVQKGMMFSNSCFYLAHEIGEIRKSLAGSGGFEVLKDRLEESSNNLSILGESWYEQVIQTRCEKVDDILVDGAKGFRFTSNQDRYDECEMVINKVVQEIKQFAQQLKGILTKGKYYTAIGLVTEVALSRILQDILALPDIPEVDSHQLGELCRIFNSLEGLFSEDPTRPSFVVAYVPSWLKFNYLSELLEASMADISYLFDEGALVDFEIDELARLIKALFADSALRTNTINKLMSGHPATSQT